MIKLLIDRAVSGHILLREEAETVMEELLSGRVETADIVRLLRAMNVRPVRVEELAGFASVMRRHAAAVFARGEEPPEHLVGHVRDGRQGLWNIQYFDGSGDSCGGGGSASGEARESCIALRKRFR